MSPTAPPILEARLEGHLTVEMLRGQLDDVASQVDRLSTTPAILLDCSAMTGYDLAARETFVTWNADNRTRILGLAIVVHKPLWFAVVATMSMISRQEMRAFRSRDDALAWARTL